MTINQILELETSPLFAQFVLTLCSFAEWRILTRGQGWGAGSVDEPQRTRRGLEGIDKEPP